MALKQYWHNVRCSTALVILVVCLGVFTDNLAFGVIIPILPPMLLKHAGTTEDAAQAWTSFMLATYGFTFFISSAAFGYAADRYVTKRTALLAGMPAMIFGLLLFMLFPFSPFLMALARGFQGISSAAVGVAGLALIIETVGTKNAALGVSFYNVSVNSSAAAGPVIGGILYDNVGYLSVFIVPMILLSANSILLLVMEEREPPAICLPVIEEATYDQEPPGDRLKYPSATSNECTPLLQDEKIEMPGEPSTQYSITDLLKNVRVINAVFVMILSVSIFTAFETVLPLFTLNAFSWHPTMTGTLFLMCAVPKLISPLIAKIIDHYGPRYPAAIAILFMSICLFSLRLVKANTVSDKIILVSLLAINNVFTAMLDVSMISEIGVVASEMRLAGQGGALVNVTLAGGLLLGPLLGGFAYEFGGWSVLTLTLGTMCAIALPGVLLVSRTKTRQQLRSAVV